MVKISSFLSLVHAFHKMASSKKGKKKTASPKIKQFMPKISEIALKNEKRTDIFGINPIVINCIRTSVVIQMKHPLNFETP